MKAKAMGMDESEDSEDEESEDDSKTVSQKPTNIGASVSQKPTNVGASVSQKPTNVGASVSQKPTNVGASKPVHQDQSPHQSQSSKYNGFFPANMR